MKLSNILRIRKIRKKEREKIVRVRFCPKCNCRDIVMVAGGQIGIFKCVDCGFQSPIFPEREFKLKDDKLVEA